MIEVSVRRPLALTIVGEATLTGAGSVNINATAGVGSALVGNTFETTVGRPTHFRAQMRAATGAPVNIGLRAFHFNGGGVQIGATATTWATLSSSISIVETLLPNAPTGVFGTRVDLMLNEVARSGRVVEFYSFDCVHERASADDLIGHTLDQDLGRVSDRAVSGNTAIAQGSMPPMDAQLTYLCSDLAAALALMGVYKVFDAASPVVIDTPTRYPHRAVGKVRAAAEKPLPGLPARYLVTVEARG